MNCVPAVFALSAESETGRPFSQHVPVCLYACCGTPQWAGEVLLQAVEKVKTQAAWLNSTNEISMVSVIQRCTVLIYSGRYYVVLKYSTPTRLMAHSTVTSPLSEDTSHPAENDKYSESGFVLDTCFFACWSSSCLLLLWSLLSLKLAAVLAGEWGKKRNRIYDAESPPSL